jgi:hypothetical protein
MRKSDNVSSLLFSKRFTSIKHVNVHVSPLTKKGSYMSYKRLHSKLDSSMGRLKHAVRLMLRVSLVHHHETYNPGILALVASVVRL